MNSMTLKHVQKIAEENKSFSQDLPYVNQYAQSFCVLLCGLGIIQCNKQGCELSDSYNITEHIKDNEEANSSTQSKTASKSLGKNDTCLSPMNTIIMNRSFGMYDMCDGYHYLSPVNILIGKESIVTTGQEREQYTTPYGFVISFKGIHKFEFTMYVPDGIVSLKIRLKVIRRDFPVYDQSLEVKSLNSTMITIPHVWNGFCVGDVCSFLFTFDAVDQKSCHTFVAYLNHAVCSKEKNHLTNYKNTSAPLPELKVTYFSDSIAKIL